MESLGESSPRSRHTRGTLEGDLVNGERESQRQRVMGGEDIIERDETICDIDESIGIS